MSTLAESTRQMDRTNHASHQEGGTPLRVLWLCNTPLECSAGTGNWLAAMAAALRRSGGVDIGLVAADASVKIQVRPEQWQWRIPFRDVFSNSARRDRVTQEVLRDACQSFHPDLLHVWGTEARWGLLAENLGIPWVLTVQGLKGPIAAQYNGGMTSRERLWAVGPKDVVRALRRGSVRRSFAAWRSAECRIIAKAGAVCCQSLWQMTHVRACNRMADLIQLDLPLRHEFTEARGWSPGARTGRIFVSSAYASPAKGLHTAVRAAALLASEFPQIQLRIAGEKPPGKPLWDGYLMWLEREARRLGIHGNVRWLGVLPAKDIAEELSLADAAVIPSFVESYCMAMAEALYVGTPVVSSYTGGTSHLGRDEQSCLFFPAGDETACAQQLGRILRDPELAARLSESARTLARARQNPDMLAKKQMDVYVRTLALSRHLGSNQR